MELLMGGWSVPGSHEVFDKKMKSYFLNGKWLFYGDEALLVESRWAGKVVSGIGLIWK